MNPIPSTPPTRRAFLQTASLSAGFLGLRPELLGPAAPAPALDSLRILILGGTAFLGPAVVEAALARGHTLTLFNRGRTNAHLFPDLEKLRGDRDPEVGEGLKALEEGEWDAVVDTSGYVPRIARASSELLADRIGRYLFVSTVSVYASFEKEGIEEQDPVGTIEDETFEKITGQSYGPLKALCEQAVQEALGERATVVRPGLIVGPGDPTDRFTYWPVRVQRGGEVLAPGTPEDSVQYIDVRDLGEWIVHLIEEGTPGTFNAVNPPSPSSMGELAYGSKAVTGGDARFTWVSPEFLGEQGIRPWSDLPVWLPPKGETRGLGRVSNARALEAGLGSRTLAETVGAILAWFNSQPEQRQKALRAGMKPEREAEALAAWHAGYESAAQGSAGDGPDAGETAGKSDSPKGE